MRLLLVLVMLCLAAAGKAAAPTFQDLMDPRVFPQPQRGMVVEGSNLSATTWQATTTGAKIEANLGRGVMTFAQRIGHQRPLLSLELGQALTGGRLTHRGPGLARVLFKEAAVRVNGDSLCMLHAAQPLTVRVRPQIQPAWHSSYGSNHLVADEWGAYGLYCSERDLDDGFDPYAETAATYRLPKDGVLWVAVCPPKPYPWAQSRRDNVVWHWSDQLGYPPDDVLAGWQRWGNIVLLQSEVMLWKDWNLAFEPRLGAEEFARVRQALHDRGMRFIVYTSPYYFLRGTPLEGQAINSFEGFTGWPPGSGTGENIDLFMAEITKVMREYRPDGLYFDGQYTASPAALYALARRARGIVGEKGILEWHSTLALGDAQCYLPPADAYVDFVLRGEGTNARYQDRDYLRFFVSGYNINNSIGVLCNNSGGISDDLVDRVLAVNGRFHTIAGWTVDQAAGSVIERYRARLTPELEATVDRDLAARQGRLATSIRAAQAERQALAGKPTWGKPRLRLDMRALPEGTPAVSPANDQPFRVGGGSLLVRAHPHTYAFYRLPLGGPVRGLVVRLSQGTDGGMSWGPAAMIRFANGSGLRLGSRADGRLQADLMGQQLLTPPGPQAGTLWLRARWLDRWGVVERSSDGQAWQVVWHFEHGGAFAGPAAELLVGKVPYNGRPEDFSAEGPVGQCGVGPVEVY